MGKSNEVSDPGEEEGQSVDYGCNASAVCNRSVLKWIIAMVVIANVLMFGIFSLPIFPKGSKHSGSPLSENQQAKIQASFRLKKPVSSVNASILRLESDIWEEVGMPYTKVTIISLEPIAAANLTEVVFGVVPDPGNASISSVGLSVLRATFITLLLGRVNLSLAPELFGNAYFFQVLKFPGGITVVPEEIGYPLQQPQVLFNFTLHNTIDQVDQNLAQLKNQLRTGLHIWFNENVFVQLTNLQGSTVDPPIIVETSIMPVVGKVLTTPRLKQLAQEITRSPARNLGLNHTLFGKVKQIQLSSFLRYPSIQPPFRALTPAPTPSQSPVPPSHLSPSTSPLYPHHHHAMSPSHSAYARAPYHRHDIAPSNHRNAMAPSVHSRAMPPSPYHHAMAPNYPRVAAPSNHHPFVYCHLHHTFTPAKCKHQHERHAPPSGFNGVVPSPMPSYSRYCTSRPCNLHQHGQAAPAPLAVSLPPHVFPPQNGPHSNAQPSHSHLPLFPSPTPLSLGAPSVSSPLSALPLHAPTHAGISNSPGPSGTPISSPKSSVLSPVTSTRVPSPKKSRTPDAELPERGSPAPAFSPVSSSSFGTSSVWLNIGPLLLMGTVLSLFA